MTKLLDLEHEEKDLTRQLREKMDELEIDFESAASHGDTKDLFDRVCQLRSRILAGGDDPVSNPRKRRRRALHDFKQRVAAIVEKAQSEINTIIAGSKTLQDHGVEVEVKLGSKNLRLKGSADQYYWQHVGENGRIDRSVGSGGVPSLNKLCEAYPDDAAALTALIKGGQSSFAARRKQIAADIGVDRPAFFFNDGTTLVLRKKQS